jgi:Ala-tRNA(Pro) deacylase
MPAEKLRKFLDLRKVKYVAIQHSMAFTAQEIAESVHVPGKMLAKTVVVNLDGEMAMVVLRATDQVSLERLAKVLGVKRAALARETDFLHRFEDCEVGAMPPFGNLYGMPLYMDRTLSEQPEIVFNAGSHLEVVRMAFRDYARLASPNLIDLST